MKLPKVAKQEFRVLTMDEMLALADAAPERYRAMILLAGTTGLRFGEVTGLRVTAVNMLRRQIRVTEQIARVGGKWEVSEPKTDASVRTVSLPAFVIEELGAHMIEFPPSDDGYIFTTPGGAVLNSSNFAARVWRPLVASLGLDGLRFHDLRHSHAAHLIEQGEHPKLISERLGHASIRVTMDTYGSLMPGMDDRAVDALDGAFRQRRASAVRPSVVS